MSASLLVRAQVVIIPHFIEFYFEDELKHIDLGLLRFHRMLKQAINRYHVNVETANELRRLYAHWDVLHEDGTLPIVNEILRQLHLELRVESKGKL